MFARARIGRLGASRLAVAPACRPAISIGRPVVIGRSVLRIGQYWQRHLSAWQLAQSRHPPSERWLHAATTKANRRARRRLRLPRLPLLPRSRRHSLYRANGCIGQPRSAPFTSQTTCCTRALPLAYNSRRRSWACLASWAALWTLSATGQGATAASIVAAATPALKWITRYLPIFYVPALVVLPLAAEKLSGAELGKITAVLGLGMPFSLFSAGAVVVAIRRLASVSLQPVPPVAPGAPFTLLHLGGCAALAVASALALFQADAGTDLAHYAQQLHLLAWTVGGLVFGTTPPSFLAAVMPHPVVVTGLAATAGVTLAGAITGSGYYATLKTYLTKGKDGKPKGAGDHLMSFLGVVVLTFGFHIYGQRALLVRHAAEIVGCAVICSLLSMVVTCGVARHGPHARSLLARRAALGHGRARDAHRDAARREGRWHLSICAAAVLATGLVGAMGVQRLLNMGGFADLLVRGLACASSCHGLGVAALAATEPAALPFCALSYGLTGIAASVGGRAAGADRVKSHCWRVIEWACWVWL